MQNNIIELLHRDFDPELQKNKETLREILNESADLVKREFVFHGKSDVPGICLFVDGLVDSKQIDTALKSLVLYAEELDQHVHEEADLEAIRLHILTKPSAMTVRSFKEAIEAILSGDTLILLDGCEKGLLFSSRQWEKRGVEEPPSETVIRGPRDGFTENIRVNTSLVRRRIKDPALRIESMKVGKKSRTDINIAYIKGTVKEGLVDEVTNRLQRIKIDAVLESGYIEELIEDAPLSPLPTIQSTERPDKVAAALLEGRVAIFVDNTPFVLIVPTSFWQYIQATDDYYSRYWVGSFFRLIRYFALAISLTLPSIYVLLATFHQEMIPTTLALTIASGREVVPFPALFEAVVMELVFELMREAGLRMPKQIGSAISIVGSLVIGQAAVQAGIVGPTILIIVAITAIASFAIPNYAASFSIRILRFPLLLASGTMGLVGFGSVFSIIILHALSIRSFGESYLAPATPFRPSDQKDILLRLPWWSLTKLPQMAEGDEQRMGDNQMPKPPSQQNNNNNTDTSSWGNLRSKLKRHKENSEDDK
ncbi:spore germination protein [Brevibacillus sp. SYSU BS000544]|uniref:spore germination protein n=1 Tax=Brevibacillus sp. SYSU BS000544 TaxID=3416443 RepID=UPI003CE576DB